MTEIAPGDEFYFQWHITERCNQRCAHCYHESYSSRGELTLPELQDVFAEMERALKAWNRIGSFSLTGGEPFMRRDELYALTDLLDSSDAVGYYDILTNGALIGSDDVGRLRDSAKLRRVQVSLEAPTPQDNDAIRGSGSFATTLSANDRLKAAGLEVAVMMTIARHNKDSLSAMIDLLAEHGVDTFATERFIPEGAGAELGDAMLSSEEARETFELVHRLGVAERRLRVLMYRPLFALVDRDDPTVGAMCSVGTNALTVMHDGTVYPCRRLPIPLGNILEEGLFKIWYDSEFLWKVRDPGNIQGCRDCVLVPLCRGCRAMAHFASGDCFASDPHCWKAESCSA
ncbi:MAG: radical SAM protein [Actinobacteria bacterium]|nr:radical SAM protein [Actinomycetota bacterium]